MDTQRTSYERLVGSLSESPGPGREADVQDALRLLGHPDPAIRDELVYPALARAVVEGRLDDRLGRVSRWLAGVEGLRCGSASPHRVPVLARSFSVLVAACVLHRSRTLGSRLADVGILVDAIVHVLETERTLVSWDDRYGWVHIVAHLGDCVDELYEFDDLEPVRADALTRGLVDIATRRAAALYAFGEYDRIAYALATALLRGRVSPSDLERIVDSQTAADAEFDCPPTSVVRANHLRSLVRALEWQLRARGAADEPLGAAMRMGRVLVRRQPAED